MNHIDRILRTLASLRITVTVIALIIALIFFSTLAQRFLGIWFVLDNYFKHPVAWVDCGIFFPAGSSVSGRFPFFGGVTLGVALLVNLLAAFVLKFRPTSDWRHLILGALVAAGGATLIAAGHLIPAWRTQLAANPINMLVGGLLLYTPVTLGFLLLYGKKGGMVLVHLSVILLVVGQGVTSYRSLETRIILKEGETSAFTEDGREYELAVIAPKADGSGMDQVTCVPQALLKKAARTGQPLALPGGPSITVDRFLANTELAVSRETKPDERLTLAPPANAPMLVGKRLTLDEAPPVNGIGQATENTPSVFLHIDGQPLALYGGAIEARQTPAVKGTSLQLRPRRYFLPYAVRLEKFSHDLYPGTSTPKNFASQVTILEQGKPDRSVHISMNQPLRMPHETLFQASFIGEHTTVLQVVRNPGWTIPYIACALGTVGLLVHFLLSLGKFLKRTTVAAPKKQPAAAAAATGEPATPPSAFLDWLPLAAAIVTTALLGAAVFAAVAPDTNPQDPSADLRAFAQMPVVAGGRVQPIDSLARNSLLVLNGHSTLRLPAVESRDGQAARPARTLSAIQWLLEVFTDPKAADTYPVFRIDHDEVKALIGQGQSKEKYFSMAQILPHFNDDGLLPVFREADRTPHEKRDARQNAVVELEHHIDLYARLRGRAAMLAIAPPREARRNAGRDPTGWLPLPDALETMQQQGWAGPAQIKEWAKTLEDWRKTPDGTRDLEAQVDAWGSLLEAHPKQDAVEFDAALGQLSALHRALAPQATRHAGVETLFNRIDPFYAALWIYIGAILCVFASWAFWRVPLLRTAFVLVAIGVVVHFLGLGTRTWLSGRPPVTNLYSSAVFVGCAMAGFSLAAECVLALVFKLRLGFALLVGATAGALTLLIAKALAADGDTMAVLQAVLDTNFWLATHVLVVSLGYAATFLAGTLGIIQLAFGSLVPDDRKTVRTLTTLIYGVLCFALLFSFVGTILGGIWADQSWGRFWGWDPKENGAMMIVLWNALILHARLGGLVKDRGLAMLAVFGNIVTAWSWFGVNQLGAGLHSYGFTTGAMIGLLVFIATNLVVIGLGFVNPAIFPRLRAK